MLSNQGQPGADLARTSLAHTIRRADQRSDAEPDLHPAAASHWTH